MKNTKIQFLLFGFTFLFLMVGNAQDGVIQLSNPSFEDFPRPSQQPRGWYDCGDINFPLETPPDTHPVNLEKGYNSFGVTKTAMRDTTYLGMVVRENESWESVAQKLKEPLSPDICYSFSIYLCTSPQYKSSVRGSDDEVNFTTPIKLRIWGGKGFCDKTQLLAESSLVKNTNWEKYTFTFSPKEKLNFIVLEAFFQTPTLEVPNGNILLDNASAIVPIACIEKK
ncbi:MAG: hypothetical protein AB8F94_00090 [Saprospiraceae bacterium]